ncbi:YqjF family protein [Arthrobacter sp. 7Tela_A1]|uniref:YqjF family protein n=1 Tax=Arthrobacter sp. 7Tela_A1 TaxID=3093745 RepID=UPI003BB489B6
MPRPAGSRPGPDPWPSGPGVPGPEFITQRWSDAVFLHWRIQASTAARYLPAGVEPDVFLGSAWVGLIGFRLHRTRLAGRIPVPWLGSFTEINVRLYTRGRDSSTGVLFVTLDASRLPAVLAARAAGIPYIWSRCRPVKSGGTYGYEVRRFGKQAASRFRVRPDFEAAAMDALSLEVTARFGAHAAILGRTLYVPNTHQQWPLYRAELQEFDTELLAAAGFAVSGPPESVLFSPGVQTAFGRPWQVPG